MGYRRVAFLVCLFLLLPVISAFPKDNATSRANRSDSLGMHVAGAPVLFSGDTLWHVHARTGSFSASDRAHAIRNRIERLADSFEFSKDSLRIVADENSYDIVYGEITIISVSPLDGRYEGMDAQKLAQKYRTLILKHIETYRKSTGIKTILIDIGLILVILFAAYWVIKYITKFFRYLRLLITQWEGKYFKGIKIRDYEILTARRQVTGIMFVVNIVRWIVIIFLIYLTLPLIFNILPWTKGLSESLMALVLNPLKKIFTAFWKYLPNLFTIIVIVIVFRYVLKGLSFLKKEIEREALRIPGFFPEWANPTYQIIRALVFMFMLIVVFPYLPGSDSPIFRGISVFLGVLLTFGSGGSLSNIIAGMVLTYMRSFKLGDRVKIGDITGDVIEKSLLVTRLRTIKNEDVAIPNSTVMSSHTINYSSSAQQIGLILHTTVTIGYDAPWRQVHQLLIDAALATEFVLREPLPFVLQTSLDDFFVSYQLNAYTSEPGRQADIYSKLHQNIQDTFNEAGVEIMSPHYTSVRDGNRTALPDDYLPDDYIPPSFHIRSDPS